MDCSMPGFPVHCQLPELAQTHIESVMPSNRLICHPLCLQSFPESGSFPVSQFFTSGGQSIEASASVLPLNILDWFPLGLTGLITLLSKGLSRVFSSTTVQKHQWSNLACLSSYSTICSWSCLFQPYGTSLCPPYSPCSSPSTFTRLSSYLLFILRI